jgi:hypothetical protein
MRTYDPADGIRYVHLAQHPAAPRPVHDECHPLPAGYANASLRARLGDSRAVGTRPALAVLTGGAAAVGPAATAAGPATAAPALRLVR